jgi:hypothetical protein
VWFSLINFFLCPIQTSSSNPPDKAPRLTAPQKNPHHHVHHPQTRPSPTQSALLWSTPRETERPCIPSQPSPSHNLRAKLLRVGEPRLSSWCPEAWESFTDLLGGTARSSRHGVAACHAPNPPLGPAGGHSSASGWGRVAPSAAVLSACMAQSVQGR